MLAQVGAGLVGEAVHVLEGSDARLGLVDQPSSVSLWIAGARPRTLPAAVVPVLVGTAAAAMPDAGAGQGIVAWRAGLAMVVALALQVGVNYANDYSDGVRGTDADRVGPLRLVGSGAFPAGRVKRAAFAAFAVSAVAGLALAAVAGWWLVLVGISAVGAAWGYTGGPNPYGYLGLGEVFVFVYFGVVATVGSAWVQSESWAWLPLVVSIPVGLLATALLVTNNLRDIPGDTVSGKQTLAVRLGDGRTRGLFVALIVATFVVAALAALERPTVLLSMLALPLALPPLRTVLGGAAGASLIPVLTDTGRLQLAFGALLALGLWWGA